MAGDGSHLRAVRLLLPRSIWDRTSDLLGFNAEVNVHVSVRNETHPWDDVAEQCRRYGIQHVLDQITRTVMAEIADPLI